jgi:4-hydroxyproline epimerase
MCGHGTIGTVTMAIEHGLVRPKTPGVLRLDTPAGLVVAEYTQVGQYVEEVRITNVPSFLYAEELTVDCPQLGEIKGPHGLSVNPVIGIMYLPLIKEPGMAWQRI